MQSVSSLMGSFFSHLRVRLVMLVVLVCAPLVVLTLLTAYQDRHRQLAGWQQRAHRMTQLAAREEEKMVGSTRQLLVALAESSPVRSLNARTTKSLLDNLFNSYPRYANLGVLKTNGEVLSAAAPLSGTNNFAGADFFKRVMETRAFANGDFPTVHSNSAPTLNFAYPVFDRTGTMQAVVFAVLDLNWFNRFGSELPGQLVKGATWTEADREGRILIRYPVASGGRELVPLPRETVRKINSEGSGIVETQDELGNDVIYAYQTLESRLIGGRIFTLLGNTRDSLFAGPEHILYRNLGWLGAATGFALVLGWFGSNLLVLKPVKALARSSSKIASGDFSVRTGLPHSRDELGRLTLAFDLMAQALQQREVDRQRATQKLQVLSHRLVEVQESERRHIARELHDEIGQSLTVAEMNLQAALQSPGQETVTRKLQESIQAVERVLSQVQDLSLNLRPSMLDDLGLEPAVRWYVQRQAALLGVKPEFRADKLERRLDPLVETECFRVAQEALTNVVRHSRATALSVELRKEDDHLHLSVKDNGQGFDVSAQRSGAVGGDSLGLLSMEERAALVGGRLELKSAPGRGTEVHAWFPLKWAKEPS